MSAKSPENFARLGKDNDLVIRCGRQLNGRYACDKLLAIVILDDLDRDDGYPERRYVGFLAGWMPRESDGLWKRTRHAEEKIKRGFPPSNRRRPALEGLAGERSSEAFVFAPPRLPIRVRCDCGLEQTIDPERLRLAPWYDGWGPETGPCDVLAIEVAMRDLSRLKSS